MTRSGTGIPATAEYLDKGTIVSPCPPRTNAVTSLTETLNSSAKKCLNLAESRTPAIPTTIFVGNPDALCNTPTIASSGFVMQIIKAFGQFSLIPFPTCFITFVLISTKSSLLIPGFLATPAVTMTTSLPEREL